MGQFGWTGDLCDMTQDHHEEKVGHGDRTMKHYNRTENDYDESP